MDELTSQALGSMGGAILNRRGGVDTVVSHWGKLLEGIQESPQAFYDSISERLKSRDIPDAAISTIEWPEGDPGSAKRLYLRVTRGADVVDICGAPFGNAFFVSSWLCAPPPDIIKAILAVIAGVLIAISLMMNGLTFGGTALLFLDLMVVFGVVVLGIIRPLFLPPRPTFYRMDTANMFYTAVQAALGEAVDQLTAAKGLRALTAEERKPVMRFMNG